MYKNTKAKKYLEEVKPFIENQDWDSFSAITSVYGNDIYDIRLEVISALISEFDPVNLIGQYAYTMVFSGLKFPAGNYSFDRVHFEDYSMDYVEFSESDVTLTKSSFKIGTFDHAFGIKTLKLIDCDATSKSFVGISAERVDISKSGFVNLPSDIFLNATIYDELILPDNLKSIDSAALNLKTSPDDVIIPDSVNLLEDYSISINNNSLYLGPNITDVGELSISCGLLYIPADSETEHTLKSNPHSFACRRIKYI